jgi:hypothetical protein
MKNLILYTYKRIKISGITREKPQASQIKNFEQKRYLV